MATAGLTAGLAADRNLQRETIAERMAPALVNDGASAVSWGAILAGAAGAAALAMLLLMLGVGLGLSSISPWADRGASATAIGVSTILWLSFTQLAASAVGGYLAGRLRTKWASAHGDEVYFRDTAHGFLAWAIASLATAAFLGASVAAVIGGGVQAGASLVGGAAGAATSAASAAAPSAAASAMALGPVAGGEAGNRAGSSSAAPMGYLVDSMFRKDANAAPGSDGGNPAPVPAGEVARIFANALQSGSLPAEDVRYVGQLVAQRTGMNQQEAEKRVSDGFARIQAQLRDLQTQAREAADKARKASAYATLWMFISLLIGAFVASLAATFGGRRRDL